MAVEFQPDSECLRTFWCNPIIHFGSRAMLEARESFEVPQCEASSLIHKSGECLCGAFAKPGELEELEYWFPETGAYIRSLEREAEKAGKPYCKWGHGLNKTTRPVGPLCSECSLFDRRAGD